MRLLTLSLALALLPLTVGCGERPEPVGPAAEASTADIEITMEEPSAGQ